MNFLSKTVLFFLLLSGIVSAQTSFEVLLNNIKDLPDTSKISILDSLCFKNRFINPRFGIQCGEKALEISVNIKNRHHEGKTLNLLGVIYRILGSYEKSLSCFFNAIRAADDCRDSVQMGFAENNISHTYRAKSYYSLALEHAEKGVQIFKKINYKSGEAYGVKAVGDVYYQQRNYEKALEKYKESYKIRCDINEISPRTISLTAIAQVYFDLKKYKEALDAHFEAEKDLIKINDTGGLITTLTSISEVYIALGEYSSALAYALQVQDYLNQTQSVTGKIKNLGNLGVIYAGMNRPVEAEKYHLLSLRTASEANEKVAMLSCYKRLTDFYEHKGDFAVALSYAKNLNILRDSIQTSENFAGFAEMESIYQNEKSWKETVLLQKNIEITENQRNFWILFAIITITVLTFVTWRFFSKRKANDELRELNATKDKFFSIVAHDLKNPFHGIMGVSSILLEDIDSGDSRYIRKYAQTIHDASTRGYQLLLNLLDWSREQTGKIEYHIETVDISRLIADVVDLLSLNASEKEITVTVTESTPLAGDVDVNIFNTILRNLLSNAIKYTYPNGRITIATKKMEEFIEISVKDTGTGIPQKQLSKLFRIDSSISTPGTNSEPGTGLGLILCKDFVEKLGGTISVTSIEGAGTTFAFTVPKSKLPSE